MKRHARATANANIALAKYWGKSDSGLNLPAVPSLSLTLSPLRTETSVTFDDAFDCDLFTFNDATADDGATRRVTRLLDTARAEASMSTRAHVVSRNYFPTASGLASSASGFAALAAAARRALSLPDDLVKTSALARSASASAARSVYGGFTILHAGAPGDTTLAALPLFEENYWDLCVIVAVTSEGAKAHGSTSAMEHSRETSAYYDTWLHKAPAIFERAQDALRARNLPELGRAMEESTFAMHACALASSPPVSYFTDATWSAFRTVLSLRESGILAYATMDAGPHVKVFCAATDALRVELALRKTPGVLRTIHAVPGAGVEIFSQ